MTTVAVLYFEDRSPEDTLGFLADGLTEDVIDQLTGVRGLHVISKGGAEPWRDPAIPRDSVARALGAGTLVQGSIEPVGDKLRVQLRLVDGTSGVDLPGKAATFDQPAKDLLALRDSIASEAANLIRTRVGQEIRMREQREGTRNTAAWSLLQQAGSQFKLGEAAAQKGDSAGMESRFAVADSLAGQAEALDRQWVDPVVLPGDSPTSDRTCSAATATRTSGSPTACTTQTRRCLSARRAPTPLSSAERSVTGSGSISSSAIQPPRNRCCSRHRAISRPPPRQTRTGRRARGPPSPTCIIRRRHPPT